MGLIAELLEWVRSTDGDAELAEAKCDPGGGDVVTCPHYQPSGMDSQPLPGDYIVLQPGPEKGSFVVVGYLDPNNAGTTAAGETRLYARDADGAITGSLLLKTDGTVHIGEDTAAALIARADKVDAELEKIKTAHNTHIHITTATVGTGSAGVIAKPEITYTPAATGADKGWVT